jgi:cytochrome c oxidase subunit IV
MERDDLIHDNLYSLSANHDEKHGKAIRKKILQVTIILTVITVIEVCTGAFIKQFYEGVANEYWWLIKWSFIILTLVKAGYIVLVFMHLGDERKNFRWLILGPYILFIGYLIFICLSEASYWNAIFNGPGSITP